MSDICEETYWECVNAKEPLDVDASELEMEERLDDIASRDDTFSAKLYNVVHEILNVDLIIPEDMPKEMPDKKRTYKHRGVFRRV